MKQVIVKQAKERIRVDIELEGVSYQLWRLDDIEYSRLRQHSMPIQDADGWFYRSLFNYGDAKNKFNLAKLFVVLEYKFGKSSNSIDDWKGSFSFPLLLIIEKEAETFHYMMNISDHRGQAEFRLYKIVMEGISDNDKFGNSAYKKPFEAEFSREEINYFISYFYGYLKGYFPAIKILTQVKPFLKKIGSNLIIYGYQDNDYFDKYYDNQEDYKAAIKSFEDKYTIVSKSKICDEIIREIITAS